MAETKPLSYFIAALIISAILIVYSILLQMLGMDQNRSLQWLSYALLIGGLIYFINAYGKAHNNSLTFGNLFAYGFKTTALVAVIMALFLVIFSLIFPEYKEKVIEMSRTAMEERGNLSDSQIESSLEMMDKYYLVGLVGGTILFTLIVGAIGSLIGAGVTKKNPVGPFGQTSN